MPASSFANRSKARFIFDSISAYRKGKLCWIMAVGVMSAISTPFLNHSEYP